VVAFQGTRTSNVCGQMTVAVAFIQRRGVSSSSRYFLYDMHSSVTGTGTCDQLGYLALKSFGPLCSPAFNPRFFVYSKKIEVNEYSINTSKCTIVFDVV
jgi:hypothetical protein